MKDQWYGDNRDLVKWGVLLELSRKYKCSAILQVLYRRPSEWATIQIGGDEVDLRPEVIQHFRDAEAISRMRGPVSIEVIADKFQDRHTYSQIIARRIKARTASPGIVFLDPDTGLQPKGKPGHEHVLESELAEIWKLMRTGDVRVFYQHQTNRKGEPWIDVKKDQFAKAIGIQQCCAKLAYAPGIARDVAFFYAQRD
jgi:hypothetical protein